MKNNFNINSPIHDFDDSKSFIDRHIGSSDQEIADCLDFLNYKTLEELVMDTLPNKIILDVDLDLEKPRSEESALNHLNNLVSKNKIFKKLYWNGLL